MHVCWPMLIAMFRARVIHACKIPCNPLAQGHCPIAMNEMCEIMPGGSGMGMGMIICLYGRNTVHVPAALNLHEPARLRAWEQSCV